MTGTKPEQVAQSEIDSHRRQRWLDDLRRTIDLSVRMREVYSIASLRFQRIGEKDEGMSCFEEWIRTYLAFSSQFLDAFFNRSFRTFLLQDFLNRWLFFDERDFWDFSAFGITIRITRTSEKHSIESICFIDRGKKSTNVDASCSLIVSWHWLNTCKQLWTEVIGRTASSLVFSSRIYIQLWIDQTRFRSPTRKDGRQQRRWKFFFA